MDMETPTIYDRHVAPSIENFLTNLETRNCVYYASEVFPSGQDNEKIINLAIQDAIKACSVLHIPTSSHFIPVYKSDKTEVFLDWKLSKFGCLLTLLNGNPENPNVARFQVDLVQEHLTKLSSAG
jgi:hypothetical protein